MAYLMGLLLIYFGSYGIGVALRDVGNGFDVDRPLVGVSVTVFLVGWILTLWGKT